MSYVNVLKACKKLDTTGSSFKHNNTYIYLHYLQNTFQSIDHHQAIFMKLRIR